MELYMCATWLDVSFKAFKIRQGQVNLETEVRAGPWP